MTNGHYAGLDWLAGHLPKVEDIFIDCKSARGHFYRPDVLPGCHLASPCTCETTKPELWKPAAEKKSR